MTRKRIILVLAVIVFLSGCATADVARKTGDAIKNDQETVVVSDSEASAMASEWLDALLGFIEGAFSAGVIWP